MSSAIRSDSVRSVRFYVLVVGIYLLLSVLLAPVYPSARLVNPERIGAHTYTGAGFYYGKLAMFGWPIAFFAVREEALDTKSTRPTHVVATRFSLVALCLDVAGVVAAIGLLRVLFARPNARQFTLRQLLMGVVCLSVILAVAVAARHEFLDPVLIYDDAPTNSHN